MKKVVVAFSGGVDSSFLLKVAIDTVGRENVLAVIASSETYTATEKRDAIAFAKKYKANYKVINTSEFKNKEFRKNPVNRCYFCKSELFAKLNGIAKKEKFDFVIDGSNYDDLSDYRPGKKAKDELGVCSPLQEAKITKKEIRLLSKELSLKTWNKPAYACLASRIPYGKEISLKTLKRIDSGEEFLRSLGFFNVRARDHAEVVRIEVGRDEMHKILHQDNMPKIVKKFKKLGYNYITLDLLGYRTGAMNEVL